MAGGTATRVREQGTARRAGRPAGRPPKTRREIVEAAAAVFRDMGYYRASMDDVAAALGIAKSSLYYYVPTKHDLLFELVLPPYRESLEHLRQIRRAELPAPAKVEQIVCRHLATVVRHHPAVSVYIADARHLEVPPELRDLDRDYQQGVAEVIAEGVAEGTLRAHDPAVSAMAVVGMCNWFALCHRPGEQDPAAVAAQLTSMILEGLEERG